MLTKNITIKSGVSDIIYFFKLIRQKSLFDRVKNRLFLGQQFIRTPYKFESVSLWDLVKIRWKNSVVPYWLKSVNFHWISETLTDSSWVKRPFWRTVKHTNYTCGTNVTLKMFVGHLSVRATNYEGQARLFPSLLIGRMFTAAGILGKDHLPGIHNGCLSGRRWGARLTC